MVTRIKEFVHEVSAVFKTRRLFRNWFGLFISYVIGDDYVRVVRRDGSGAYLECLVSLSVLITKVTNLLS